MKIYMEVYGCAANQGDASIIQGILERNGYEFVDEMEKADILIISTCTVIDTTQQRMIHRLNEFKKTGKKVIVSGCMASAQQELVKSVCPNAILLPPRSITYILDAIEGKTIYEESIKAGVPRKIDIRVNIPIAEGCIYNCSYCITKIARGKLKSYPMEKLVEDIKYAVENGAKEIRLTAQDTASYGFDMKDGTNLAELIKKVASIEGEFRIRVGMMHPLSAYRILDELMDAYSFDKVYKFLHLPIQSASPDILKAMARGYDMELFKEIVNSFRKKFPHSTFATDIIVAFPGESEHDFNQTISFLKEIEPDITNVTRFSPRPKTRAWKMKRMDTKIAKERSRVASKIVEEISFKRNKLLIGKRFNVLFLQESSSAVIGKTEGYRSVFSHGIEVPSFQNVIIKGATPTHLEGEII